MHEIKIRGDMRLFIFGTSCVLITAALFIWAIWMAELGMIRADSPSQKRIFETVCAGLAAFMLFTGWCCMPRWFVRYTFSQDAITISHGVGRKAESYEARAYCAIDAAIDSSLSFGPLDRNSYYLVMSRQRLPISAITHLANLRGEKDMVIIRLTKKNRRLLQEVAVAFPQAAYAPGLRRVLAKVGA